VVVLGVYDAPDGVELGLNVDALTSVCLFPRFYYVDVAGLRTRRRLAGVTLFVD